MHRGPPQARAFTAKAACCSACFLLAFLPAIASAGTYSGGAGTAAEPFRISTVSDWQELTVTRADWDKRFDLIADLDMNGVSLRPIAHSNPGFTGVFDGNEHVIRNAHVILGTYLGLFGWLGTGGQIRRLGVEDVSIVGGDYVGGLVGYNDGAISYCYSTGFVSGDQYVGGLVGFGGIGTILICYSAASVSGSFCVGGLVGHTNGGNISNCYSTGFVSGDEYVGGLVAWNAGTISNCYSTGSVSGTSYSVGGLVGHNGSLATIATITNCYSNCSVSGDDNVGGPVGSNYNSGSVSKCYSTGCVSGGDYVGGLVGYKYAGVATSAFWDVKTSGWTASAGGTGKTTAEMQDVNTFLEAGWDFLGETANRTESL
jgi:hypothetical protein